MKNKLKKVLLVDDDKTTNVLNSLVIKQSKCAEEIITVKNGIEALKYLITPIDGEYPNPDLIILDINMPGMDGWEFMEEYSKLDPKCQAHVVVVMLTTSLSPDDREQSLKQNGLNDFMNKPLTKDQFNKVIEKNFPELYAEMRA